MQTAKALLYCKYARTKAHYELASVNSIITIIFITATHAMALSQDFISGQCHAFAGETALTLAAGSGEEQTVLRLLEHGADVNRCRPGGAQPIHTAAASGRHHLSSHTQSITYQLFLKSHRKEDYAKVPAVTSLVLCLGSFQNCPDAAVSSTHAHAQCLCGTPGSRNTSLCAARRSDAAA